MPARSPSWKPTNAAVGQSIEHGGVTMTLDNVAMDVSGLDAFFTVQGNEAIEDLLHREGYEPDWEKVGGLFNLLYTSVNGDENALYNDQNDYYLDENGRLKIWGALLAQHPAPKATRSRSSLKAQCNVGPGEGFALRRLAALHLHGQPGRRLGARRRPCGAGGGV